MVYLRVSTIEQAEGGRGRRHAWSSLDTQRERCEAYCLAQGLTVAAVEVDAGVSGGRFFHSRPAGRRVLALLKRGLASHVVAVKLDRLFRSVGDALTQIEGWTAQGVSVHLLDGNIDTSNSVGRLVLTILSGVAAMEREQLGERVAEALRARKLSGRVYAARVYGYRAVAGLLVPVPGEQAIIARIVAGHAAGESYAAIARTLNAGGVPSSRGGKWQAESVRRVVQAAAAREEEEEGSRFKVQGSREETGKVA